MKKSRYLHHILRDNYSYWYNPLTNSYFRLPATIGQKLYALIENDEDIKAISETLYDKLTSGGFLVEDDVNELDIIRKKYDEAVNQKHALLVVLPTLNCNYKCWYCIQEHKVSAMSAETMERVKRHIDHLIEVDKIESLQLEWFGGEPFMYFDKVIVPIAEYALEKCQEAGIPFHNTATTNAYFLTPKVTGQFERLKFDFFQITLDGPKESHDKVKFQPGLDSAFERALTHINNILHQYDQARVLLRINYTHENLKPEIVEQVCEFIESDVRMRVQVMPKKVWQENESTDYVNVLFPLIHRFEKAGFVVQYLEAITWFTPCYASRKYYSAINFNGNVLKCTANDDLHKEKPLGIIDINGQIVWLSNINKLSCQPGFENDHCGLCDRLPCCMGLCPRNNIQGMHGCAESYSDNNFPNCVVEMIEYHYRHSKNNNSFK